MSFSTLSSQLAFGSFIFHLVYFTFNITVMWMENHFVSDNIYNIIYL